MVRAPEIVARTVEACREDDAPIDTQAVVSALARFDGLWEALLPVEQARMVRLLVDRVTVGASEIAVDLRHDGIRSIVRDMISPRNDGALA